VRRRRATLRGRLRRPRREGARTEGFVEIEAGELSGIFAAPAWLRDLGFSAWLLVGVAAALVGAVWFLALTETIVIPVITAGIIASVASPAVDWLKRRGIPRGAGAALVFLAIIVIGILVGLMVLTGIASQADSLSERLKDGAGKIESWAKDLGVDADTAQDANDNASASVSSGFKALTAGLAAGIDRLASLAVFVSFTALSLFFLLKDAPTIGAFVQRHLGVPMPVARVITTRTTTSLRGYFVGVTIVAAFSAVVVAVGALALGVPLAGTIAVVTFLGGYIPYLGAWTAGAFAVLIALGSEGPGTAAALAVVVLLANGALQQMVQPIAFGATLGIHPLAVLIVTIAGGALFGTIGLVLAAPLTAAAVKISADLARARAGEEAGSEATSPPSRPPEAGTAPSSA
jgi:predicted PurR-regulated permease PerM